MLLNADQPARLPLLAGGVYRVVAGRPDRLQDEARNVWAFLQQAVDHPLGLIILAGSEQPADFLGDLASASPVEGQTCSESYLTLHTSGTTGIPKTVTWTVANILRLGDGAEPNGKHSVGTRQRKESSRGATCSLAPVLRGEGLGEGSVEQVWHPHPGPLPPAGEGTEPESGEGPTSGAIAEARWLLCYAPHRWAGVSVLAHAIRTGASVVVPRTTQPADLVRAAREFHASHVSLTPSHFRRVLLSSGEAELRDLAFRQITFGGEAASQAVLDAARRIWPRARVSHVYASTEAGDICCVSDGLAGIPQAKFSSNRYSFSTEGELFVSERPTGDLWELRDGRYHFVGRRREMINVGGIKVSPLRVEDVATSIEGVEEARAYAQASPLMGQLVALDYRGTVAERELRRELRARLPKEAWPALIRKVDCIKVTDAGKVDRIDE